jgi:hypothetical protein
MLDTLEAATIGHNNPPSPYAEASEAVSSLRDEAQHWLDGSVVSSQQEADAVAKLLDLARKAKKQADEARKVEAKPFDDGKAEVQARYKPLLDGCDRIADSCKQANTPWLLRLEAEKRQKAEEARKKAEEQARKAQEALAAARATNLASREEAEMQIAAAKAAEALARKAEKDTATAKGGARAMGLRTYFEPEITNVREFARWAWENEYDELCAFLTDLAKRRVSSGARSIPGVTIHERKAAV